MSEILGTFLKFMAAIMAIAAVLAIGSNLREDAKSTTASADLSRLVFKIRTMYGGHGQYVTSGLTNNQKVSSSIYPDDWKKGINQWGGNALVWQFNGALFHIYLDKIPNLACEKIMVAAPPAYVNAGFTACNGNTNDPVQAINFCTCTGRNGVMMFYYG